MARDNLLLVDPNPDTAAVLALCLKQAGYSVATAHSREEAQSIISTGHPDLVLVDTALPDDDAFTCFAETRSDSSTTDIPFIFITEPGELNHHADAMRPDHSECLFKPVLVKEVTTKVAMILEKKKRHRWARRDSARTRFSGRLEDWSVVDLLQTIDMCKKSGELILETPWGTGQVWFNDGQLLDAALGTLQGDAAVYRMLALDSGAFVVEFKPIRRASTIRQTTQALLLEGLRRVDETNRLREQLPRMDLKLYPTPPDAQIFEDRPLSHTQRGTLSRFEGGRSAAEVIEHPGTDELEALKAITELYFAGYLTAEPSLAVMIAAEDDLTRSTTTSRRGRGPGGFSSTGPHGQNTRNEPSADLPPPPDFLDDHAVTSARSAPAHFSDSTGPQWRPSRTRRPLGSTATILGNLDSQLSQIESGVGEEEITEPYPAERSNPAAALEALADEMAANHQEYANAGYESAAVAPIDTPPRPRPRTLLFEEAKSVRTTPLRPTTSLSQGPRLEESIPIRKLPTQVVEVSGRHRVIAQENGSSIVRRVISDSRTPHESPTLIESAVKSTAATVPPRRRLLPTAVAAYLAGALTLLAVAPLTMKSREPIQDRAATVVAGQASAPTVKLSEAELATLPSAWFNEGVASPLALREGDARLDRLAASLIHATEPTLGEATVVVQALLRAGRGRDAIALARWAVAQDLPHRCELNPAASDLCTNLRSYLQEVARADDPQRVLRKVTGSEELGPVSSTKETWQVPLRVP